MFNYFKTNRKFKKYFYTSLFKYIDLKRSFKHKKLCIDVLKFKQLLQGMHGDFESKGKTMEKIIRMYHGHNALALFKYLIDD